MIISSSCNGSQPELKLTLCLALGF
jgi:hypothetical protein